MKVYLALYNSMTQESSYETISVHATRMGAEVAIDRKVQKELEEWRKLYPEEDDEPYPFGMFQDSIVQEVKVLN